MAWYKIYAGLGGGFGGANYHTTEECDSEEEACKIAYGLAVEEYESYAGCHGLLDYDDCWHETFDEDPEYYEDHEEECHDMAQDMYREEIESWISYYVKPATGPEDRDDE